MGVVILLVVGVVLFVGIHSTKIIGVRDRAVARIGEDRWMGLYSLVAAAGLAAMVFGYGQARQSPSWLWSPTLGMRHATLALMFPVFPLLGAAYTRGYLKRWLRHPMLLATILWGLAHLLANGGVHDAVLFGGILAWAVLDLASWSWREGSGPISDPRWTHDLLAVGLGGVLYAVTLLWSHAWIIGIPLL